MVYIYKNKIFSWHLISSGFTEVSDDVSAVPSSAKSKGWAFYASFTNISLLFWLEAWQYWLRDNKACFSSRVVLLNEDWFPLSNDVLFAFLGWYLAGRAWLFYFKSQRNRSKLVDCLHIPLAMRAMFQSKRKSSEEMLSQAALSCFHTIRVPLLSQSEAWNLLHIFSFKFILPPPSHSDIHLCLPSAIQPWTGQSRFLQTYR